MARALISEHLDLELRLDRLWAVLHAPPEVLARDRWKRLLVSEVRDLRSVLEVHFEREESAGYFAEIAAEHPELSSRLDELRGQHDELRRQLAALEEPSAIGDKLGATRRALRSIANAVIRHEELENDLIARATLTDFGGGD